ncbi:MAG: MBL fold metallo-hydrolase [Alicyclobacillaceae bacterium]|uniref:MBL fold metallo-hydrolase n=1 Tax=Alicyclobacillus sp. SP_1 TaxID=2942475 RepID=UPI002157D01A|nr:MBL fold metallo-hydrolase [Alicyclobacillus sp. SP_1]MCY0887595.1 MBL fold metallo-hydrolase [Alicyclobacillaceae bacterium]
METSSQATPESFGHDVYAIDLLEQGQPYRTAAYVILDDHPTLIETGSAASHETLLQGLKSLGLEPKDLAYVIVTHVHLDHAGGAGQMMAKASAAKLVVHPRGARHMADPSKLWAGAASVYGDRVTSLFGSVQAVPEDKILIRDHLDTLDIGQRSLTFFDSPGHAKHHFTILDESSDALFAGDALGIRYRTGLTGWNFEFILPSSSPVDFDPDAVHSTMEMLRKYPFQSVYHAHFGKSPREEAMYHTERAARAFEHLILSTYHDNLTPEAVAQSLRDWIRDDLKAQGYTPGDMAVLDIDVLVDALGLLHFAKKHRANPI